MTCTRWTDRDILRLSVPAIVSNVTVPLLGLCDTAITGHLGSEVYLAAISVGAMMLNIVFWLFGFLRMGTSGMTATAYGAGDSRETSRLFVRSLSLGFGIGLALLALSPLLFKGLELAVGADPEVSGLVQRYFTICMFEAPALLGTMAVTGWFVGMQSTVWPMVTSISVNVINICVSYVLVFPMGMGFEGTAWGTLTANWAGLAIAVGCALWWRRGRKLWQNPVKAWRGGGAGRFFKVNSNLFVRSFCVTAVTLGVTAAGGRLGTHTLAVNAVMMQFFTLFSYFMDGFAFSAEALAGRWYGARDGGMLRVYVRRLLQWSVGIAVLFAAAYLLGSGPLTRLLTDDSGVRAGVASMRPWLVALPLVSVWAFIYDGFYIGITNTGKMLLATVCATIMFYVLAFIKRGPDGFEPGVASNNALWLAFLTYLLVRGVLLAAMWPRAVRGGLSPS